MKKGNKILLYVFTFLYIFSLRLFGPLDSTILVGLILTFSLLINRRYRNIFSEYIKKIKKKKIIFVASLLILWALISIVINQTNDYSYLVTFLHLLVVLFIGVELVAYFGYMGCADEVVNVVVVCFLIQTALQWLFLFFPDFSQSLNFLRGSGENFELLQEHYRWRRGIALSGAGFFSLSSSYGIVILLYCSRYNSLFSGKTAIRTILFFFLLTGVFFAGRTGFLALPFVPFLFFRNPKKINKKILMKVFVVLLTCSMCMGALFWMSNGNEKITRLYNYSFELVNNWLGGGGLRNTSTDALFGMYDIEIPLKTFIIGDAQYEIVDENGNKAYYMKVDPGYLRKILYFGIIGVIISFVFQILIFDGSFRRNKVFVILFLYMIILEIKGEIIGLNLMVNSILVLPVIGADYVQNKKEGALIKDGN